MTEQGLFWRVAIMSIAPVPPGRRKNDGIPPGEDLQARVTDCGLVVTLGDQLFVNGRADLRACAAAALNELTDFLDAHPNLTVVVEATPTVSGRPTSAFRLSQRRADAVCPTLSHVKCLLHGSDRWQRRQSPRCEQSVRGGREYNRRVEVIIKRPTAVPP